MWKCFFVYIGTRFCTVVSGQCVVCPAECVYIYIYLKIYYYRNSIEINYAQNFEKTRTNEELSSLCFAPKIHNVL